MSKTLVLAFSCAALGSSLALFGAQAFPISSVNAQLGTSDVTLDRLSPRSLWRLPAEWGRRRCACARRGSGAARRRGAARGRGTARRLWGGIAVASAVPALRRPLIAAATLLFDNTDPRTRQLHRVRLPRNLRESLVMPPAAPSTRWPGARTRHSPSAPHQTKLNQGTTRRSSTERRSAYWG